MAHRTCSIDECEARHYAKGFCRNHYNTWKRHGDPLWFQRGCAVDGCIAPRTHGDYCTPHSHRFYRYGDPLAGDPERPRGLTLTERFWRSVEVAGPDECWTWRDAPRASDNWYATIRTDDGRVALAHRVSYEIHNGPIPDGLVIDHVCHNRDLSCTRGTTCSHRRCVNPAHLEAVTQEENVRRSAAQLKGTR